ncbi:MAG: shikimate kinase [Gemmatimonadota bacterium]
MEGPVLLTGFMATGKSKVGRALARRMGWQFLDTDAMVETRAGKSIARIFAEDGEEAFRRLELECVVEASRQRHAVVALGGGAITQDGTRQAIRDAAGVLVCLQADEETILERVGRRGTRPLLAGLTREQQREKIRALLAERAPYYAVADITLSSTEAQGAEETAALLLRQLETWHAEG